MKKNFIHLKVDKIFWFPVVVNGKHSDKMVKIVYLTFWENFSQDKIVHLYGLNSIFYFFYFFYATHYTVSLKKSISIYLNI